jgi:hypothetical protein
VEVGFGWKLLVAVEYDHSEYGTQGAMLGLTKNLQRQAAILIAVTYALCILAPAAALAVIASPASFRCAEELNATTAPKQVNMVHSHAGGAAHHHEQNSYEQNGALDHQSDTGDKDHARSCCGLFCVPALAHDPGITFGVSAPGSSSVTALASGLSGRAPPPLHRPPIA